MKIGDSLNGYVVTTEATNAGGGQSQWCQAERDGTRYFLKMFLAPKFPLPDSPGSPEGKAVRRARCLAFEQRHLEIGQRLKPASGGTGNLVVPEDFFRVTSTYVKVMPWVDGVPMPAVNDLTGHQLRVILLTLVLSLRQMHDVDVVHGDVKPDNVLLATTPAGLQVAKLIDLDEAYVSGSPPERDGIVGDPTFYAPELLHYVKTGEDAHRLTPAADVFSLGVLLHLWLAGDLPVLAPWAQYPCEQILAGGTLDPGAAPEPVRPLLASLLAPEPADRPTLDAVSSALGDLDFDELVATPVQPPRPKAIPIVRPRPGAAAPLPPATDEPTTATLRSTVRTAPEEDR